MASQLATWPLLAGWSRWGKQHRLVVESWGKKHLDLALSLSPYQRSIAYDRTWDFYQWRMSEPQKKFYAATLDSRGSAVGLVYFNEQWGRLFIREVLAEKSAGVSVFALLLHEVIRYCGMNRSYQIWSSLPDPILTALGFADVKKYNEFRHDIAVRCYRLESDEEQWVHDVFAQGKSGFSSFDFDC